MFHGGFTGKCVEIFNGQTLRTVLRLEFDNKIEFIEKRKLKTTKFTKKNTSQRSVFQIARLVYKPSSVLNGHLSRRYVAVSLKRLVERAGNPILLRVLHRVGFTSRLVTDLWVSSYLAFPSLPNKLGGFFLLHFP